jgi:hypothetical protein
MKKVLPWVIGLIVAAGLATIAGKDVGATVTLKPMG